jgi:Protein of unknown function (DUF2490)
MKNLIYIIFLSFAMQIAYSQSAPNFTVQSNQNAWFMYFGDHKFSDKWGVHLEAQLRRNNFASNPQQLLLRTGINYHYNANVFFTAGYCFVQTNPYGVFPVKLAFPEHRLWEQVQIKNQIDRFEFISRFRLEQRYSQLPVYDSAVSAYEVGDAIYTNRARLLNRVSIPFKGKTIVDKSFYISAYDEFLINFGKNIGKNIFDQNRAYIALGYKMPKVGKIEAGFMQQDILKSDGVKLERNATFQLGIISNINFYHPKKK